MRFKDYYAIMGVARDAAADDIKKAYRKLARKFHPDVSKEANAEERFKEVQEAYETLKDPEKRAAYDQLGTHAAGQEFRPPPGWEQSFGGGGMRFEDIDLSDLFASFGGEGMRAGRARGPARGRDFEAAVQITLEQAFQGAEVELDLAMPEVDAEGRVRRVPRRIKVRIPRGVADGKTLRVPGKGGKGAPGAPDGDLYLAIHVVPHALYRLDGQDLYLDLPITPSEAVLGTAIDMPTPGGKVTVKVRPGTRAGQQLRLAGRGLARPGHPPGDLYAVVQIVVPSVVGDRERELYRALQEASTFDPRAHFATGGER